jgi:septum formation inhibitor-activating ATPase MinD
VSTALNSGVPLSAVNNLEMAAQFDRFTRRLLGSDVETRTTAPRTTLGLQRFASLW